MLFLTRASDRAPQKATSKQQGYQTNRAANICWQLLGDISLLLFEGENPAVHANEADWVLERSENCYALLKRRMQCVGSLQ